MSESSDPRFRTLYAAHFRDLLGFALRRTARPEDAADVVADTFLVAWRRLERGWAEQYGAGNDAALTALRGSASWPVMRAMASEGDYPAVVAEDVELLAGDRSYEGWRQGWGC